MTPLESCTEKASLLERDARNGFTEVGRRGEGERAQGRGEGKRKVREGVGESRKLQKDTEISLALGSPPPCVPATPRFHEGILHPSNKSPSLV